MRNQIGNVCIRCGKLRVEVRTWQECLKGVISIHTLTACPDSECQKIVDQQFAAQKEKREGIIRERKQRVIASRIASQNRTLSLK